MSSMYSNMVQTEHQQRQDAGRGKCIGQSGPHFPLHFAKKKHTELARREEGGEKEGQGGGGGGGGHRRTKHL